MISLFSRSESEIEKPRDRDREVKYEKNSREFSRNETLAGYCKKGEPRVSIDGTSTKEELLMVLLLGGSWAKKFYQKMKIFLENVKFITHVPRHFSGRKPDATGPKLNFSGSCTHE